MGEPHHKDHRRNCSGFKLILTEPTLKFHYALLPCMPRAGVNMLDGWEMTPDELQ
jgi:hypothetical protein